MAANVGVKKDVDKHGGSGEKQKTRVSAIAARGIRTSLEFAEFMSALMSDIIEGRISTAEANAAVNAGGKLLKVIDMQYRYGQCKDGSQKIILLAPPK